MHAHHGRRALFPLERARPTELLVLLGLIALGLVAFAASLTGCNAPPQAPTAQPPTVSGYVYQLGTTASGEPRLAAVSITIEHADGASSTTLTNSQGFYTLMATNGAVAISAMKAGFETNRQRFALSGDTTLNFSLALHDAPSWPGFALPRVSGRSLFITRPSLIP